MIMFSSSRLIFLHLSLCCASMVSLELWLIEIIQCVTSVRRHVSMTSSP